MPFRSAATRARVDEPVVDFRADEPLFPVDARPLLARRFVARADRPATPCARLRCAPNAAARANVLPHSGHTNSPLAVASVCAAARLLLARFFAAGCLFDVAIISFPMGTRMTSQWRPYANSISRYLGTSGSGLAVGPAAPAAERREARAGRGWIELSCDTGDRANPGAPPAGAQEEELVGVLPAEREPFAVG